MTIIVAISVMAGVLILCCCVVVVGGCGCHGG